MMATALDFELATERIAAEPPEARGVRRDEVRLMVANGAIDARFLELGDHLAPGDLLVVNSSPTMPAALEGRWRGAAVGLHLSTRQDDGTWTVEMRKADRSGPILNASSGDVVSLPAGGTASLRGPAVAVTRLGEASGGVRLWSAEIETPLRLRRYLNRYGRPIRYLYVRRAWPLDAYQTVFADRSRWPGSAEMPSAARPFSWRLVQRLVRSGVLFASVRLDAGVSSLEAQEPPLPERFCVPPETAVLANRVKRSRRRVIAVGTTVTRALESAADDEGRIHAATGWADLVLGPDRPAKVVDGIISGWHPPEASHIDLLEAVVGRNRVANAYEAAVERGYLWHEFGDSCLFVTEPLG